MFEKAKPIWIKEMECRQNTFVAFKTTLSGLHNYKIAVAAATFYRLFVNGQFIAYGPARTGKGYARVDLINLPAIKGNATIEIEVAGYYCRSLSTVKQPSFLIAEVIAGDKIIAYTGRDFYCREMSEKVRYVERYSLQRHFGEIWDDTKFHCDWQMPCVLEQDLTFIDRVAPYPSYKKLDLIKAAEFGRFAYDESRPCDNNRYSFNASEFWGVFKEERLTISRFDGCKSKL